MARPEVDVLLWDWGNHSPEAVAAYQKVDPHKPTMNVEVFGARAQGFVEIDTRSGGDQSWVGWVGGGSRTPAPPEGRKRVQGVIPDHSAGEGREIHRGKSDFLAEIECAATTPGFSLFGHFPGWYQGPSRDPSFDNRFDLGGQGTLQDPGIRWYFEAIAKQRGLQGGG